MGRRIIIIVESKFCKRDYDRFGVSIFEKKGFIVEVWDISPFQRPEYNRTYFPPDPTNFKGLIENL